MRGGGGHKRVGYLCMIPERKTDNVCSLYKHKDEKGREGGHGEKDGGGGDKQAARDR